MTPNEFWSYSDERRSQRFYVALCEFTSALLDYGTGIDLLNRKAIAPTTFHSDGTTAETGRLNWASTCFYYSLVHLGRMLVFLPLGDFHMSHDELARCFSGRQDPPQRPQSQCPKCGWPLARPKKQKDETDGLRKTAKDLSSHGAIQETDKIRGVYAKFEELERFYADLVGERTEEQKTEERLRWFGEALKLAKELRNNNNYEALLIAHEYDHDLMTQCFWALARTTKDLAHKSLELFGGWFARYLETNRGEPWDCATVGKIGFARRFFEHRVLEATQAWYGKETGKSVEHLIKPIIVLATSEDRASTDQIRDHIKLDMFSPKRSLMQGFEQKVHSLRSHLEGAPEPRRQSG
ncbi:MAG TPA: hypothetical protein VIX19_07250 [Terriglobales bacterium]